MTTSEANDATLISVRLAHTLQGHTSDVNAVIFSPTHAISPLFASCSSDKTIRLWNLDYQSSKTLTRHTYQVHWLAFSPIQSDQDDSTIKYMASVSTDGTCFVWDLATTSVLKEYKHDSDSPIRVCEFAPNGAILATAGDDELINLWDITAVSSRPIKTLAGHSASIVALRFFSTMLISGSFYGDLKIWMVDSSFTGPVHFEREAHDLGVTCLDILSSSSADDHRNSHLAPYVIASGGNDNLVKIWHCSPSSKHPLKHVKSLKKHSCAVMCVSFGIQHYLASGSGDKTIIIWNFETGHLLHQFQAHTRYVTCCAFSSDGQYLASGSNDRNVNIWQIDYSDGSIDQQKSRNAKPYRLPTVPVDQWSTEMVQEWFAQFGVTSNVNFTGRDLLSKSDNEILDLFNNNDRILNELSSLRHHHFVQQLSLKRADQNARSDDANLAMIPDEFVCPITHELMADPVCVSDGYTYERRAIEEWLTRKQTSPMMNLSIVNTHLYPNKNLKKLIDRFVQQR